jgi:hypothetical protein
MPTPTGPVQGLRATIKLQIGVNVSSFGGMNTKNDAGGIPDNAFQLLENAMWVAGCPLSRPGLQAINTSLGANVFMQGIFDAGDVGAQ